MKWTEVSPGISIAELEGYRITRIEEKPVATGRVGADGKIIMRTDYYYIAVKGSEKFTSTDLARIQGRILNGTQAILF